MAEQSFFPVRVQCHKSTPSEFLVHISTCKKKHIVFQWCYLQPKTQWDHAEFSEKHWETWTQCHAHLTINSEFVLKWPPAKWHFPAVCWGSSWQLCQGRQLLWKTNSLVLKTWARLNHLLYICSTAAAKEKKQKGSSLWYEVDDVFACLVVLGFFPKSHRIPILLWHYIWSLNQVYL